MVDQIPVTRSSMPPFEEYCEEIKELWRTHWLTNMGAKHEEFRAALEGYLECPRAVLCANGHLALENILAAMRFPAGSEVLTTPFTFASTTHAIVRNGLVPVFCDIREDNYTLDPGCLEKALTARTVAVLPVHVYGNPCDTDAIGSFARRHGLKVVYDAAHAFGARYRGKSPARFGDAAMFSFHATKVFHTIEGGVACTADGCLADALSDLKNFGIHGEESVTAVGGNAKMNEFQAAMGICNLRHLDGEIAKRKTVFERYMERLDGIPGLRPCPPEKDVASNYAYFPLLFDGVRATRDGAASALAACGIHPRKYFHPLTSDYECYRDLPTAGGGKTPVAARVARNILTLPLYPDLPLADVDRICDIILSGIA
ncbi:MAG: DegT/DnrJ/EryC1/StrS family aminotransferase [Kiritimatiellae bacterium]|nr:DegT/DnrJ/EryC1/StrS family aminotransferase [Kiritimatiellia bacterium]